MAVSPKSSRSVTKNAVKSNRQIRMEQRQREEEQLRITHEKWVLDAIKRLRTELDQIKSDLCTALNDCGLPPASIKRVERCLEEMRTALRLLVMAKNLRDRGGDIQKIAVLFIRASFTYSSSISEYRDVREIANNPKVKDNSEAKSGFMVLDWNYNEASRIIYDELNNNLRSRGGQDFFTPFV